MSLHSIELAKKQASEFRSSHGLNSSEPFLIESFLIKENLLTIFMPLSENFSGMALKYEDKRGILINSNQSIGRQHFSIAHELYHLYVQQDFQPKPSSAGAFNKQDPDEFAADQFAVFLLMPEDGILKLIPNVEIGTKRLGLRTIFKISSYFRVSLQATWIRLEKLGYVNRSYKAEFDELVKQTSIKTLSDQFGGDTTLYQKGREGHLVGDLAQMSKKLFENDVISEISYLRTLDRIGLNPYSNEQ